MGSMELAKLAALAMIEHLEFELCKADLALEKLAAYDLDQVDRSALIVADFVEALVRFAEVQTSEALDLLVARHAAAKIRNHNNESSVFTVSQFPLTGNNCAIFCEESAS